MYFYKQRYHRLSSSRKTILPKHKAGNETRNSKLKYVRFISGREQHRLHKRPFETKKHIRAFFYWYWRQQTVSTKQSKTNKSKCCSKQGCYSFFWPFLKLAFFLFILRKKSITNSAACKHAHSKGVDCARKLF